ncbi:response regulator transcription factor [Amphibacillus jilinensis]|uniref:response regulator transcription factor n=1 Tax=Amphibacillus jilinensis TaxID=1216008 RepID=UPI0003032687|nr:response regulator transcription factor [Amphibacillus jilinensis]
MNRVVLVDDEHFVRKGIMTLIDWEAIDYEVVGEASDGEDALQLILEERPDVVLTDIRMPVYDGLELIQQIKKNAKTPPKFIVISGYSDFEYAQRAVRLGVTDFLLKPIDKQELEDTFSSLTEVIEKERLEEQANQRFINYGIYQRIIVDGEEPNLNDLAILTEDINKECCYLIIDVRNQMITDMIDEKINRAIANFVGDPHVFIHPFEREGYGVILQEKHLPQNVNEVPWFLSRLKVFIEKEIGLNIFLFAGVVDSGLKGVRSSYKTAMIASNRRYYRRDDTPLMYNDELARCHIENKQLNHQIIDKLLEEIEENNIQAIKKQIEQWIKDIQHIAAPIDAIKMFLFHLEKELEVTIQRVAEQNEPHKQINGLIEIFNEKKTLNELKEALLHYTLKGSNLLCTLSREKYNGDIYKVKRYIHKHFTEPLTLKKIANQFYMNPVYLGQLFKKTYGVYFKDYLLKVRIDKAKQILRQTDLRIYEVAEEVGFGSPDYFVTQFEKMEGRTPSKYRQKIIN